MAFRSHRSAADFARTTARRREVARSSGKLLSWPARVAMGGGLLAVLVMAVQAQPPAKPDSATRPSTGGAKASPSASSKTARKEGARKEGAKKENASKENTKKESGGRPRRGAGVTPEQEAAVMTLVRQHHPDLEMLLSRLKRSSPSKYTQAVRSLFRTSVRLANIQERDMERYSLELQMWKLDSQAQLLALKAVRQPKANGPLRDVIEQRHATRVKLLVLERDRQQERLSKLQSQIDKLSVDVDAQLEQETTTMLRSAKALDASRPRRTPVKAKAAKPAGKSPQRSGARPAQAKERAKPP